MNAHGYDKIKRLGLRYVLLALALLPALILTVSLASARRMGGWNATEVQLQNLSQQPAAVTLTWWTVTGALAMPLTDSLPARESRVYSPTFQLTGSLTLDAPPTVLAVVTHWDEQGGAAQWPLIDEAMLSDQACVPHFVHSQAGMFSRLSVHNLSDLTADLFIYFYDAAGTLVAYYLGWDELSPEGARFLVGDDIPGLPYGAFSAYVLSDQPIYVDVARVDGSAFALAHAPAQGGFHLVAPLFMTNHLDDNLLLLNSKLVLQNTGEVTASGVLSYYAASSGNWVDGAMFQIAPNATLTWPDNPYLPAMQGQVQVTADQPLAGLVLGDAEFSLGLWDYTALALDAEQLPRLNYRSAHAALAYAGYAGWHSRLAIANLSSYPTSLDVRYVSAQTGVVLTEPYTIVARGVVTLMQTLPPDFEHAAVSLYADGPIAPVVWSVNEMPLDSDPYMAYEAQYARLPIQPRYVAPAGIDTDNLCIDEALPCATIQHAVDVAYPGEEVRVASGNYTGVSARAGVTQMVYLSKTLTVRGGYDASNWALPPDPDLNQTVLDAQGEGRVMYVRGKVTPGLPSTYVVLAGLRFVNGNATGLGGFSFTPGGPAYDAGGGLLVLSATIDLVNDVFNGNLAGSQPTWTYGGGALLYNAGGLVSHTVFENNTAAMAEYGEGGGLCIFRSQAVDVRNSFFTSNLASAADSGGPWGAVGGGLSVWNSTDISLTGNEFWDNRAHCVTCAGNGAGGGLSVWNSTATLVDNLLAQNTAAGGYGAGWGGGLYLYNSPYVTLESNRFMANQAVEYGPGLGGGVFVTGSTPILYNNILADNGAEDALHLEGATAAYLYHNTLAGNTGWAVQATAGTYLYMANSLVAANGGGITGTGSIDPSYTLFWDNLAGHGYLGTQALFGDPAFVDPIGHNYHICTTSAALDAGDFLAGLPDDIDGEQRPYDVGRLDAPDLGADEVTALTVQRPVTSMMSFGAACARLAFSDTGGMQFITLTTRPGQFPTNALVSDEAVSRTFVITPSENVLFSATLSLCYDVPEIGDLDEANLQLYRWTGNGWQGYATLTDTVNHIVTAPAVNGFSRWLIGVQSPPPTVVGLQNWLARPPAAVWAVAGMGAVVLLLLAAGLLRSARTKNRQG